MYLYWPTVVWDLCQDLVSDPPQGLPFEILSCSVTGWEFQTNPCPQMLEQSPQTSSFLHVMSCGICIACCWTWHVVHLRKPKGCIFAHPDYIQTFQGRTYQYCVLLFGLSLSPYMFTQCIQVALEVTIAVGGPVDSTYRQTANNNTPHQLKHVAASGLKMNLQKSCLVLQCVFWVCTWIPDQWGQLTQWTKGGSKVPSSQKPYIKFPWLICLSSHSSTAVTPAAISMLVNSQVIISHSQSRFLCMDGENGGRIVAYRGGWVHGWGYVISIYLSYGWYFLPFSFSDRPLREAGTSENRQYHISVSHQSSASCFLQTDTSCQLEQCIFLVRARVWRIPFLPAAWAQWMGVSTEQWFDPFVRDMGWCQWTSLPAGQ